MLVVRVTAARQCRWLKIESCRCIPNLIGRSSHETEADQGYVDEVYSEASIAENPLLGAVALIFEAFSDLLEVLAETLP